MNDKKGGLTLQRTIQVPGDAVPAAAADFNHDRLMDLAYAANGGLHILFGDGKGGFTPGPVTPVNWDGSRNCHPGRRTCGALCGGSLPSVAQF